MHNSLVGILFHDNFDCRKERQELFRIHNRVEVLVNQCIEDMLHEFVKFSVLKGVILSCEVFEDLIQIFG